MDRDTHIKEEVFTLEDEEKTKAFAEHLGKFLSIGDVVFLHGEVGAGKTTLCRYLIRSLIGDAYLEVPSPTYTLIQIYEKDALGIAHIDLYRLAVPEEVEELGLEDLQKGAILLIEWPEKGKLFLPPPSVEILLQGTGKERQAHLVMRQSAIRG